MIDNSNFNMTDNSCRRFSTGTFNSHFSIQNGIFIVNFNIRSFNANICEFVVFLDELNVVPDILIITETWFSDASRGSLNGFTGVHCSRINRVGGGVSVFVNDKLGAKIIPIVSDVSDVVEVCAVRLHLKSALIFTVVGIYRPPSGNISEFIQSIDDMISSFDKGELTFVCGDFNVDLINPNNNELSFIDLMHGHSFVPVITLPTREPMNGSPSLIDHIWCNSLVAVEAGIFEGNISDHYVNFVFYPISAGGESHKIRFRDHSRDSITKFRVLLSEFVSNFHRTYEHLEFAAKFTVFYFKLHELYNKCCPVSIKTVSGGRLSKPWIDNCLS